MGELAGDGHSSGFGACRRGPLAAGYVSRWADARVGLGETLGHSYDLRLTLPLLAESRLFVATMRWEVMVRLGLMAATLA